MKRHWFGPRLLLYLLPEYPKQILQHNSQKMFLIFLKTILGFIELSISSASCTIKQNMIFIFIPTDEIRDVKRYI